jgi:hypothetical protein
MSRFFLVGALVVGLGAPAFAEPSDPNDVVGDHDRVDQARAAVDLAAVLVDVAVQRVSELKIAWDREVAGGHPVEAGKYASAHSEALAAQLRAQDALRMARAFLDESREKLRSDGFRQQVE